MAELIDSIQEKLKEETWTRATISNFTSNNLNELAGFVKQAKMEGLSNEVLDACYDHLERTKDSISALYMAGMISLEQGNLNDTSLEVLADILIKNHKEQIISSICSAILEERPTNKFALRTLAEIQKAENNENYWDLYKTLVKVDFDDYETVRILAEHEEAAGNTKDAVEYYKKALLRSVKAKNYTVVKEVWKILLKLIPEEIDFFQTVRRKIAKTMGENKTTLLMQDLYEAYKPFCEEKPEDGKKWDVAINILKQNLEVEPKDFTARKELMECYKGKYGDPNDSKKQKRVEEYLAKFMPSYRDVFEAYNDFEKHIVFDVKTYVFHKSWGLGRIKSIKDDILLTQFATGPREISLKMAVTNLQPLPNDHIWVTKAITKDVAALKKDLYDNVEKTLKIIITSFNNSCDFKRIKAELEPLFGKKDWTSWSNKAKKELEANAVFGVDPDNINCYTVRDRTLTAEEKLSNEFKAQKQFFARADILMRYFNSELDTSSDLFDEMYSYFTANLKNIQVVNQQILASYLIMRSICSKVSTDEMQRFLCPCSETFESIYNALENPKEAYDNLKDTKDTDMKAQFILCVKELPNWVDEYIKLFPVVQEVQMLTQLMNEGHTAEVQKLVRTAFENYRDFRDTVIYFFKNFQDADWFKAAGVSFEKQLITLINIIELCYREINSHVNSTENKKIIKNAQVLLFEEGNLYKYMEQENNEEVVKKMYTLVNDVADMDPSIKQQMRSWIQNNYKDLELNQVTEVKTTTASSKGMIVTNDKLNEKKALLKNIQDVQMPENAKEIAVAREQGDLKENAEYKAAREKQHMLQLELSRLQGEINRAVVFDPTTLTTAVVSFATDVVLTNNTTGADETYTILGPWESNPDEGILSYMSPFGSALMDKKPGEVLNFTINERNYNYTVKEIKPAKI